MFKVLEEKIVITVLFKYSFQYFVEGNFCSMLDKNAVAAIFLSQYFINMAGGFVSI